MLARERNISQNGQILFRTPLLVPSFSSKGFPEMKKIMRLMTEFITDAVLVSAYDVHYKFLDSKLLTFPSIIFLDSGGYEARVEHDLSESYGQEYRPKKWKANDYESVLANWRTAIPTVAVSYDSPTRHSPTKQQLAAALRLKDRFPSLLHEFLLKPERKGQMIDPTVLTDITPQITGFTALGVTEHELDHRIIGRMQKIAHIRRLLDESGVDLPIHIFGSLDSLSTVLYFISGAEIFDGLTWLRFGFEAGRTIYRQN